MLVFAYSQVFLSIVFMSKTLFDAAKLDKDLKVHWCRYENLTKHSSSYENSITKIAHYDTFHFFRYTNLQIYRNNRAR